MYELVELDPMTGEEDQLICTGTWAQMEAELADTIDEMEGEWEDGFLAVEAWGWYRIQPATA